MQIVVCDKAYVVTGTASGDVYSGQVSFVVIPLEAASNIQSDDIGETYESTEYILDIEAAQSAFLTALSGLFDDQSYGGVTVSSPAITEYSQSSADVTP